LSATVDLNAADRCFVRVLFATL